MPYRSLQDIQHIGAGGELTASEELRVQEIQALADTAADEAMGKTAGSVVKVSPTGEGIADILDDSIKDTHIDWGTGANQVSSCDIPDHNGHSVRDTFIHIVNRGVAEAITVTLTGGLGVSWTSGEIYDRANLAFVSIKSGSGNVTNTAVNYLKWVSGTTLTLSTTDATGDEVLIAIGSVYDGNIDGYREMSLLDESLANIRRCARAVFPTRVISGMSVHEDTDATNPLDVTMDAGTFCKELQESVTPVEIKSRNTAMVRHFHTGGVWDSDTNAQIETTNYDNGTQKTAIPSNKWVKGVFIYMNEKIGFVYPTECFNTVAEAQEAALPAIPTGLEPVPKLTAIVYQQGVSDFTTAIWQDVRAGIGEQAFGGVSDHGGLAGLSDDDHPQYVKDSEFTQNSGILVGTGAGTFQEETGATLRTSIGCAAIDQTMYIGTTAVVINRASAALTLAGITLTTPNLGTPSALVGTNISGTASSLTAGAVTNATLTTALTVNTGTLTLTADVANNSVLTIGAGASSISGANTGDQDLSGKANVDQTMYIGTTAVVINRGTGALTLAGLTLTTPNIGTPSAGTLTNCTFPTLNQNTTGTAANLSGTPALPNGTTATSQAGSDNSTKLATTAYVDAAVVGGGATVALDNLASVAINISLTSDTDITDDLGTGDVRWKDTWFQTISAGLTATDTLKLRGRDVDGSAYVDILTITSNNTVTADLNALVTIGGNAILYSGGDAGTPSALVGTNISGTASSLSIGGTAAVATTVTITDNEVTDEANPIVFVAGADPDGGNLGLETDGTCTYNPSTGIITTTGFAGPLTGNVTGNCSGSSGSCTGESATVATITGLAPDTATTQATQGNITSLGTLTALQVDNININLNTISSTAGTDLLITPLAGQQLILDGTIIIDAGVVTGATSITSTAFVGALTGNADTVTTNANLTGIVTSTGNATAIANKAIAIAKLADGTDGQLITWDASGVIATVAVGTADQVLTSNGVGAAPTFQDAAGGGDLSAMVIPGQETALSNFTIDLDTDFAAGNYAAQWKIVDNTDGYILVGAKVPSGATSISSIQIFIIRKGFGGNLYLEFNTKQYRTGGSLPLAAVTDTGNTSATYAQPSGDDLVMNIDVPSASYNGLSTIVADDIIYLKIRRQGDNASDTYSASMYIVGALFTFA